MINIIDKHNCCGCNACSQKCPKNCITMIEDTEGFTYPSVNKKDCIDCGLCEKVCPVINNKDSSSPLNIYAAINKDEKIRLNSSSGGLFTAFSETIIKKNGVVFGARFSENWEVQHDYIETCEDIHKFRGSKYVQSKIGNNFKIVETFLKEGRLVLFSGTPCQVHGLKRFLRKEYDNLITIDFICHGVPSPKVWRMYIEEIYKGNIIVGGKNSVFSVLTNGEEKSCIEVINFRNKTLGWKKFSFYIKLNSEIIKGGKNTEGLCEPFMQNLYMGTFLSDIILRPSCYRCPSKGGKSSSDITIADFWGINKLKPDFDDDKGVSILMVNSLKGRKILSAIKNKIITQDSSLEEAIRYNPSYIKSSNEPKKREVFFRKLEESNNVIKTMKEILHVSIFQRICNKIIRITKNIHSC